MSLVTGRMTVVIGGENPFKREDDPSKRDPKKKIRLVIEPEYFHEVLIFDPVTNVNL